MTVPSNNPRLPPPHHSTPDPSQGPPTKFIQPRFPAKPIETIGLSLDKVELVDSLSDKRTTEENSDDRSLCRAEMVSALPDQERENERKPEVNVNLEIMDITAVQERSNKMQRSSISLMQRRHIPSSVSPQRTILLVEDQAPRQGHGPW